MVARLIEYEGEPHGLLATVPDRLNRHLLDFLAEVVRSKFLV